jgi:hypothetical protein
MIVVMHELFNLLSDARATARPGIVEAVDSDFECMKPFFGVVSVSIVDPTAQSCSGEGSPIAKVIDEKLSLGESVFLADFLQKHSRRSSAMSTEQRDIEDHLRLDLYCSIHPRPLAVGLDSGFVDCDP